MKTFNIRFRSDEKLRDFIYENQIIDSVDILIQIFSYKKRVETIKGITTALYELLPSATILGTTTDGEVLEGRILTDNIVLSITIFEHSYIKTTLLENPSDGFEAGVSLAKKIVTKDTKAVIIFSSSHNIDAYEIIKGVTTIKQDVVICGGLCGDSGEFEGGLVFNTQSISSDGILAVSLNGDKLNACNRYTSEWEPVGREFKITKSKENRVFTVDKMSVYKLYEKYLGVKIAQKLPLSGLQFPFVFKDLQSGDFIARSVHSNPSDGSLIFATKMKLNQTVQIAFGNAEKMLENSHNLIKDIVNEPIQSLFIYASSGRRRFLQNIAYAEIEPYNKLGNNAGFFGYGEFFSNSEQSIFLNQSMTLLALSESKAIERKEIKFKSNYKKLDLNLEVTQALSNIAKVSSRELQELNQKLELRIKEEVQKNRNKDSIMIHNSKLAQMGEMMSMIAHQWRQPLSAISATSTGLQVKIELGKYSSEFFLESLGKIEGYVKHLSDTINDFAEFFKPSKKKELTTLNKLIDKSLFILSPSFTKNEILISTNYKDDITVNTYSNEVIQVLINLLKNAENILITRVAKNPHIQVNIFKKEHKNCIEIIDNAGGIDEEIIEKIFELYFTTNDTQNSTGLGLYMSKFIIEESCKGTLSVENVIDGAKFTIVLD